VYSYSDKATLISQWTSIAELPKALAEAIDLFDEVRYVQEPAGIDVDKITPKNLDETVNRVAAEQAARERFSSARSLVSEALARKVIRLAVDAVPGIIEQLRSGFDEAAEEFVKAVEFLPNELTAAALIDAGPAALEAYQRAQTAQQAIARVDGWLASLPSVPGLGAVESSWVLRVMTPRTRADHSKIMGATPNELGLNPHYVVAARNSIEFQLHTPVEQRMLHEAVESQPVEKPEVKVFGG
jgi:tetratricopeptide (TPR) repeat protein